MFPVLYFDYQRLSCFCRGSLVNILMRDSSIVSLRVKGCANPAFGSRESRSVQPDGAAGYGIPPSHEAAVSNSL